MKRLRTLIGGCLLLSAFTGSGQNVPTDRIPTGSNITSETITELPFQKGNWSIPLERIIRYRSLNQYQNDNKVGEDKDLNVNLEATYFMANRFGLGVDLGYDWSKQDFMNDATEKSWSVGASLTYGLPVSTDFHLYARILAALGGEKLTQQTATATNEEQYDLFSWGVKIGAPIRLGGSSVFATPGLSYTSSTTDFETGSEHLSKFRFGLSLESYFDCPQTLFGTRNGLPGSRTWYDAGSSWIGYHTKGSISFGQFETRFDNLGLDTEGDDNSGTFKLGYNYYVLDNFALGLELSYRNQNGNAAGNDIEFSNSMWSAGPRITANLPAPGCWNHFYASGGVSFGATKNEFKLGNQTTIGRDKLFSYEAGIGYNVPFTNSLGLTLFGGYEWITRENKDNSDQQVKRNGLSVTGGFSYFF